MHGFPVSQKALEIIHIKATMAKSPHEKSISEAFLVSITSSSKNQLNVRI